MKDRARDRADMLYDFALWLFNIMLDIFFREIRPRGSHKIPTTGPTIFVAAPHANQVTFIKLNVYIYTYTQL